MKRKPLEEITIWAAELPLAIAEWMITHYAQNHEEQWAEKWKVL